MVKVLYTKNFVAGNLKGLTYPSASSFNDVKHAFEFISYLAQHTIVPVDSIDSSNYVVSRIEMSVSHD